MTTNQLTASNHRRHFCNDLWPKTCFLLLFSTHTFTDSLWPWFHLIFCFLTAIPLNGNYSSRKCTIFKGVSSQKRICRALFVNCVSLSSITKCTGLKYSYITADLSNSHSFVFFFFFFPFSNFWQLLHQVKIFVHEALNAQKSKTICMRFQSYFFIYIWQNASLTFKME